MNTVKLLLVIVISALLVPKSYAQLDEKKMQRDLEISKNILATLLKDEMGGLVSGRSISADYVAGFGVIIKVPSPLVFNRVGGGLIHNYPRHATQTSSVGVINNGRSTMIQRGVNVDVDTDVDENEEKSTGTDSDQKQKRIKNRKVESYSYTITSSDDGTITSRDSIPDVEEVIVVFLEDYADLIGQLKPEDKIMIKQQASGHSFSFIWTDDNGVTQSKEESNGALSVTTTRQNISDFKSGKIDKKRFREQLVIAREQPAKKAADLEIFASTIKQYFSPQYSKSFFTDEKPDYERIEGLGVIFDMNTYSAYVRKGLYYFPAEQNEEMDDKARKQKVEELYPVFVEDLKAFMVDYGRTIRSLTNDEKVIVKVRLTRCDNCDIPQQIELSIPYATLLKFDKQEIPREKAIKAIAVD